MSIEKNAGVTRRNVLKGIAIVPVAVALGHVGSASAAMPRLSVNDPVAKSLGYTEKSTTKDQTCANCNLYQGGKAEAGGCTIFVGKEVVAAGWCKSWVKKA